MGIDSARNVLGEGIEIGRFLAFYNSEISSFSTDFCSVCDTCDSKKTTSLLEGARVCTREVCVSAYSGLLAISSGGTGYHFTKQHYVEIMIGRDDKIYGVPN